mmetsp:Transcript_59697/g.156551  ORF Transcript_59697/g.156551 Transcript_59697/m.156551 type:complete len:243 (+) Transcript_59697:1942-2670(+)
MWRTRAGCCGLVAPRPRSSPCHANHELGVVRPSRRCRPRDNPGSLLGHRGLASRDDHRRCLRVRWRGADGRQVGVQAEHRPEAPDRHSGEALHGLGRRVARPRRGAGRGDLPWRRQCDDLRPLLLRVAASRRGPHTCVHRCRGAFLDLWILLARVGGRRLGDRAADVQRPDFGACLCEHRPCWACLGGCMPPRLRRSGAARGACRICVTGETHPRLRHSSSSRASGNAPFGFLSTRATGSLS